MQRAKLLSFIALVAVVAVGCIAPADAALEEPEVEAPVAEAAIQAEPQTVSATGEVVPIQWADLAFPTSGAVVEILVETGDTVEAGDVLARLDTADLAAQVAEAEAAVAQAEANLAIVEAGPSPEEIEAAENNLSAATARSVAAAARRDALQNNTSEADVVAAQNEVNAAQVQVDELNRTRENVLATDPASCREGEPCPLGAYDSVTNQLRQAELELAAAQANLNETINGPNPNSLRVENARVWLTYAQVEAARARLEYLQNQPLAEEVAVAEAELEQVRVDLEAAQQLLEQAVLVAPFPGTITAVYVDNMQFITPGQPIVQMSDLEDLRVQTIDLTELDVARVSAGDTATVTFDALPGVEVTGEVLSIASRSSTDETGVMYRVLIALDEIPERLRWGMTSFVDIEAD